MPANIKYYIYWNKIKIVFYYNRLLNMMYEYKSQNVCKTQLLYYYAVDVIKNV